MITPPGDCRNSIILRERTSRGSAGQSNRTWFKQRRRDESGERGAWHAACSSNTEMWTSVLLVYGVGLAVTTVAVLRTRVFRQAQAMNLGSILLWPFHWCFFLFTLFQISRRP